MDAITISTLVITIVLVVERVIKQIKHCKSGCCELDMKNDLPSPKPAVEIPQLSPAS